MMSQTAVARRPPRRSRRGGIRSRRPASLSSPRPVALVRPARRTALEVGAIVLRKHAFDLNQFYWMSRHFVWLIPLTNLLIFLALGLAFSLVASAAAQAAGWLRGCFVP